MYSGLRRLRAMEAVGPHWVWRVSCRKRCIFGRQLATAGIDLARLIRVLGV